MKNQIEFFSHEIRLFSPFFHPEKRKLTMNQSHGGYLDEKWSKFLTRFCQNLEEFHAEKFAPFKQGCLKQVLALPNLSVIRLVNIGPLRKELILDFFFEHYENFENLFFFL